MNTNTQRALNILETSLIAKVSGNIYKTPIRIQGAYSNEPVIVIGLPGARKSEISINVDHTKNELAISTCKNCIACCLIEVKLPINIDFTKNKITARYRDGLLSISYIALKPNKNTTDIPIEG